MNKELTPNTESLTVTASSAEHFRAADETTSCHWRHFGPFTTRISVRPGPRPRVVLRVLRKNDRGGFFHAITHA